MQGQDSKEPKPYELHPESLEQSAPVEMDARSVAELPGTEMRSELDGRTPSGKSKMGGYFPLRKKTRRETANETSSPNNRAPAPPIET